MKYVRLVQPLLLCVIIAVSVGFAAEKRVLKNAWGGNWEPFWVMGADSTPSGFDIDVMEAVVKEAGFTIEHTPYVMPWKRHLFEIEEGKIDLASGASYNEERAAYAYFIGPIRYEYIALYVRKNESKKYPINTFEGLLTLPKIRVGAEIGSIYGTTVDTVLEKLGTRVQRLPDFRDKNRLKLHSGRLDCIISYPAFEALYGDTLIEQHPLPVQNVGGIYIMLSKKGNSSEVYEALKAGLETVKTNGVYDSIITNYSKKYHIKNW